MNTVDLKKFSFLSTLSESAARELFRDRKPNRVQKLVNMPKNLPLVHWALEFKIRLPDSGLDFKKRAFINSKKLTALQHLALIQEQSMDGPDLGMFDRVLLLKAPFDNSLAEFADQNGCRALAYYMGVRQIFITHKFQDKYVKIAYQKGQMVSETINVSRPDFYFPKEIMNIILDYTTCPRYGRASLRIK